MATTAAPTTSTMTLQFESQVSVLLAPTRIFPDAIKSFLPTHTLPKLSALRGAAPLRPGRRPSSDLTSNQGRTLDDFNNFEGRSLCTSDGAKVGGGTAEEEGAGKYDLNGGGAGKQLQCEE
jgi:hypothetical protein